jgi:hypothetical protein
MNKREISSAQSKLNSAPGGFGRAIHEFVDPLIQSALAGEDWPRPRPAPIGNGRTNGNNNDPPKNPEPGEGTASPAPQIDQIEDSTQPVSKLGANGKQPRKSGTAKFIFPPLPPSLIDALAEGTIQLLPAIQQRLLDEGVIATPILPGAEPPVLPEEAAPVEAIPCKVELRLGLNAEPKGPPSSAHFDRDSTERFCRLVRIWLNTCNPVMRAYLEKSNVRGVQFFAGAALARCLGFFPRSALVETLLAQVKTCAGLAPNQQITTTAFARRLAGSALLAPIKQLPIFGQASENAIGRSFALVQIDVAIPLAELGVPWNRHPSGRKEPKNHGIQ